MSFELPRNPDDAQPAIGQMSGPRHRPMLTREGFSRSKTMAEKDRPGPVRQAVGSTGQSAEPGVARQLSELARSLQAEIAPDSLLEHIAKAAVNEIPGTELAGITLVTGREFATRA